MTLDIQTANWPDIMIFVWLSLSLIEGFTVDSPFRQAQTRKYQGERDRFLTG